MANSAVPSLDETHDPALRGWVEGAQDHPEFPIQNLPYGVALIGGTPHVVVAIGDQVLDLAMLETRGLLTIGRKSVFDRPALNWFMARPPAVWRRTRARLSQLLSGEDPALRDDAALRGEALRPRAAVELAMPFRVAGYTDFYASREHATNVGRMFRGDADALNPNWLHMPVGYNGRASTVVRSGTPIRRPMGQLKGPDDAVPRFAASAKLDIELEMGAVVGTSTRLGERLTTEAAYEAIFGYVLLNDWSARDIQFWEYRPLGPFQGKAFATTISPWVVTRDALEPFRVAPPPREVPLLPYLEEGTPNNFAVDLSIELKAAGRQEVVSRTSFAGMYYSSAQQLAHHSSSGCAMSTGDLLGSGTISGATRGSEGSLIELTQNGKTPLTLSDGSQRTFLEDGDTIILSGWCEREGAARIGFGECEGTVIPASV